jgi:hypothetical protein
VGREKEGGEREWGEGGGGEEREGARSPANHEGASTQNGIRTLKPLSIVGVGAEDIFVRNDT